jgi:uracil-DNA glycosylase family 4
VSEEIVALRAVAASLRAALEDAAFRGFAALPPSPGAHGAEGGLLVGGAAESDVGPARRDAHAREPASSAGGPAPADASSAEVVAQGPPQLAPALLALAEAGRARVAGPEHPDGIGADGLGRIRADLGDCQRCGLCRARTHLVFGVGDPDADLMIIGEGPGEQEDQRGEPFVGPAGQMLDRMLSNVLGLERDAVYIANVVKCRPPGNRNPLPEEIATCLPFLERQIRAVQPKLVVLLGAVALRALLGGRSILRERGREVVHRPTGVPVIPTLHPAYLLRKPEDKKLAFEDLKLARARYDALGGRR